MLLRTAIQDFYEEQEYKGNSPATVLYYRTNFEHFMRDTGITNLSDFSEGTIRAWLIEHRHLSSSTVRTYDRALRVLAGWLHHRGYLSDNPMRDLPKPKVQPREIVTFTETEVVAMLREAKRSRNPMRDAALVTLLFDTGVRIGEAVTLRLHDVQWDAGWLRVTGKTGERVVPFGRKSKLALRRYIDQERTASSPSVREVFLTMYGDRLRPQAVTHLVSGIARRCDVKATKLGPHTFRHTFAVEFIRAGGDAFTLQHILGHSTLEMTRRYVHLAKSDLRSAHRRFAPGDRLL